MDKNILVVEDEKDIGDLISANLQKRGFKVTLCETGKDGANQALRHHHDLMILDWMLPELEGIEVCKIVRSAGIHTPILMLTAKDSEIDRILGLELGADDYLSKPFSIPELEARIKALLRRATRYSKIQAQDESATPISNKLKIGQLEVDTDKRDLTINGKPVNLTLKEFDLLAFFMRNPGKSYTRQELLDKVWGTDLASYEHAVSSHINRLRSKIEPDLSKPIYIKTVWGIGYRFADPDDVKDSPDRDAIGM